MAKVPLGKLARAMRLVSSGMGSSGWACSDILILLQLFMQHFLMTFFLYSTLFSFPCPLVRTKFPSRVIDRSSVDVPISRSKSMSATCETTETSETTETKKLVRSQRFHLND